MKEDPRGIAWESVSFFVTLSDDLGEMEPVNQSADVDGRSTCHLLLMSRASPLPRRKLYGPLFIP